MKKYIEKKQKNGEPNQINTSIYIGLSAIIILLLVLMFIVINLNQYMRQRKDTLEERGYINLEQGADIDFIERGEYERSFKIIVEDPSKIEDSFKQAKIPYSLGKSLKDLKDTEENVVISGTMLRDAKDLEIFRNLVSKKRKIIIIGMPHIKYIENNNLKEILGLARLGEGVEQKELTLVPGFMLGGLHEFKKFPYETRDARLLYSTKVYAYGKDEAPVIWRNIYEDSEVYMINGDFMDGNVPYGIMSGIMAEIYQDYLYPVVNGRLMVYEDFPYVSDENKDNLEKLYNRDAMKFQYDILMPDILTISERRSFIPNGYLRVGFKEDSDIDISNKNIKQIDNMKSQIYSAGGDIGLRYSGDIKRDRRTYKKIIKDEQIKSVVLNESIDNMDEILKVSNSLESVVGPWDDTNTFEYLTSNVVYIPFTINGIAKNDRQKLEFVSAATAFGAVVHNLTVEDIILNESSKETWTQTSKNYIKTIDNYRANFDFLKSRSATSTAKAVKAFKKNSPKIIMEDKEVNIRFEEGWIGPSSFILRTEKLIQNINGGTYKDIEEGAYLITALDKDVDISLHSIKNTNARR